MKRSLVMMATVVGLSLLGCGGVTPEQEGPQDGTVSQFGVCDTLPTCESMMSHSCKPTGTRQDCCYQGATVADYCVCYSKSGSTIGTWVCP